MGFFSNLDWGATGKKKKDKLTQPGFGKSEADKMRKYREKIAKEKADKEKARVSAEYAKYDAQNATREQAMYNARNREPGMGGLISSSGWAKNDAGRANANPRSGSHSQWQFGKDRYDEQMNSPETQNYLQQRSQEMGNTEFVGDLADHLTSNRYYSNDYSEALAGAPTDLGPAGEEGFTGYYNSMDPMYGGLVSSETWNNNNAGGKYAGATGYDDTKFGLVKLGLFGTQGPSSYQDVEAAGRIYGALNNKGMEMEDIRNVFYDLREGKISQENLDLLEGEMGESFAGSLPGSTVNQGWDDRGMNNPPAGVFFSERPGWVGGFDYDSEETGEQDIFGKYSPFLDNITVSPDDKNVRETLVHELGHRGMSGLSRLDPQLINGAMNYNFGDGASDRTIWEDPTTGESFTANQFLANRGSTGNSYGQSPEHNLIDATSRNRNNRNMYESFGTGDEPGDTSTGIDHAQNAYGILGRIANSVSNYLQAGKKNEVDTMRTVGPEWYGGVTGSATSTLIPKRR